MDRLPAHPETRRGRKRHLQHVAGTFWRRQNETFRTFARSANGRDHAHAGPDTPYEWAACQILPLACEGQAGPYRRPVRTGGGAGSLCTECSSNSSLSRPPGFAAGSSVIVLNAIDLVAEQVSFRSSSGVSAGIWTQTIPGTPRPARAGGPGACPRIARNVLGFPCGGRGSGDEEPTVSTIRHLQNSLPISSP